MVREEEGRGRVVREEGGKGGGWLVGREVREEKKETLQEVRTLQERGK